MSYHARIRKLPDKNKYRTACIAVSVGRPYHEEAKLSAVIAAVNRNFSSCFIDVSDSLQRWNSPLPPDQALKNSIKEGDKYLERNAKRLEEFSVPFRIYRWEDWRRHSTSILFEFNSLFTTDSSFRESVIADATAYVTRNGLNDPQALSNSVQFILEEAAVMVLQSRIMRDHVKLYPAAQMGTFVRLREKAFPGAPQGLERSVYCRLSFENKATL